MNTSEEQWLPVLGYEIRESRRWFVHVLLITTFEQARPFPAAECRHLDGNPANNVLGNLRWGTRSENAHDRVAHGRDREARKTYWQHFKDKNSTRSCKICRRDNANKWNNLRRAA